MTTIKNRQVSPVLATKVAVAMALLQQMMQGEFHRNGHYGSSYPAVNVKHHARIDTTLAQDAWLQHERNEEMVSSSVAEWFWDNAKEYASNVHTGDDGQPRDGYESLNNERIVSAGRSGGWLIYTGYAQDEIEEAISNIEYAVKEYESDEGNDDDVLCMLEGDIEDAVSNAPLEFVRTWLVYSAEIKRWMDRIGSDYLRETNRLMADVSDLKVPSLTIACVAPYNEETSKAIADAIHRAGVEVDGYCYDIQGRYGDFVVSCGPNRPVKHDQVRRIKNGVSFPVVIMADEGDDEDTVTRKLASQ